jgi:hypothetical protein
VTGFVAGGVTVGNGTPSGMAGSGTTYMFDGRRGGERDDLAALLYIEKAVGNLTVLSDASRRMVYRDRVTPLRTVP